MTEGEVYTKRKFIPRERIRRRKLFNVSKVPDPKTGMRDLRHKRSTRFLSMIWGKDVLPRSSAGKLVQLSGWRKIFLLRLILAAMQR